MKDLIRRFVADRRGATAIEYALIAFIVGVGIVVSLTSLANVLGLEFMNVATYF
jgi:pilus assembly protein Flp/PilA